MVVSPISGFMPIPLALMIPFMATQSLVMGEAFGKGFQYGKRRISAMSNEEFNKLTVQEMGSDMYKSYEHIIPDLKVSINQSTELQNFIVAKLLDMPRELASAFVGGLTGKSTTATAVGKTPGESFRAPIAGTSGSPKSKQRGRISPKGPTIKQKYFIKNFKITIKYTKANRKVAPNRATVQSTAFKWFRLSHPDTTHKPIKYTYGRQNSSGYWRYTGTLEINAPIGKKH